MKFLLHVFLVVGAIYFVTAIEFTSKDISKAFNKIEKAFTHQIGSTFHLPNR